MLVKNLPLATAVVSTDKLIVEQPSGTKQVAAGDLAAAMYPLAAIPGIGDHTDPAKGAGLIGWGSSLSYPVNSVGWEINNLVTSLGLAETSAHAAATYQTIALAETSAHAVATYLPITTASSTYVTQTALAGTGGAGLVGFIQSGTGSVLRTDLSKERETLSAEDKGGIADGATNNQAAIANLLLDTRAATFGPGTYLANTGNFASTDKQTVHGAGRENTFLRCGHATNPLFTSTAQFTHYEGMTIDRSAANAGSKGISHISPGGNVTPLEGFRAADINMNGHGTGYYLRDFVLATISDGYVQSCGIGIDIAKTGANYNTVLCLSRLWIRACTTTGLKIAGTVGGSLDQVTFDGASGAMPLGADISDCGALRFTQSWWELLQLAATVVNCRGLIEFDGGACNGSSLATEAFYVNGAGTPTNVVFSGAWDVSNMGGKTFAIADTGAVIYVRSPQLLGQTFSAVSGGKVIFECSMEGSAAWNPANCNSLARTASTTVTVTGARLGDVFTASFENGTTDPGLFVFKADVFTNDTVTVFGFNTHTIAIDLGNGTLTVRGQKRALTS